MLCNKKLFAEAGITAPPRTWAELVATAKRISRPEKKIYGTALPGHVEWAVAYDALGNFLVANDGYILDREGAKATIGADRHAQEAFRFVCELTTVHHVTPPGAAALPADVIDSLFANDRLGIMFSGPWLRPNFLRLRPEFDWPTHYELALMPAGVSSGHSGSAQGGWLLGAFSGSKHPKEALKLLEFFSQPESLATVSAVESLPPRRSAMAFPPFKGDPFYEIFFRQLESARPPLACVPQLPNVARAIQRAYQRVVSGGASVDETVKWLDDKLTNHLLQ
jgi:ABC-type glycerol-3-phosphate transport system substrate-binding protein